MKKIRTRYAPSPTGFLHIGGARSALFGYLLAKHNGGDFIIRIEDTDIARNVEGGEESQLQNLAWLGIIPDESPIKPNEKYAPYRQSERLDIYKKYADELISKGLAYKAYDTSEEIEKQMNEQSKGNKFHSFRFDKNWLQISEEEKQKRDKEGNYSIRISLPKDKVYQWKDLVRGKIQFNSNEISEFVLIKRDGIPTYNFANVIDDHLMEMTHVVRGEEHISNTPKQLALYDMFGWEPPKFGHLTIITNMEGKKLSKRDTETKQFIEDYKNEGYSADGIFNFLALLGWTDKEAKEVMKPSEIIERFDHTRWSKAPSKFDIKKMEYFSNQHIKSMDNKDIEKLINIDGSEEWKDLFIETYKQGARRYLDLQEAYEIYQSDEVKDLGDMPEVVKEFAKELSSNDFSIENIQESINKTKEITGAKGKDLFMPIRVWCTYQNHGPELAKAIYLFGKEKVYKRLNIK